MIYHKKWYQCVFFMACLFNMSCSGDKEIQVREYIQSTKEKKGGQIDPIPAIKPIQTYQYPENDKRRNPFKPIPIQAKVDTNAPNETRVKDPLEKYPLDALKFVGSIKEGPFKWALISVPTGQIIKITKGQFMGQNFGKVLHIEDDSIDIEERYKVNDAWEKRITKFKIKMKE